MLKLTQKQQQQIYQHAQQTYPQECCGILFGRFEKQNIQVVEVWETENAWQPQQEQELFSSVTSSNKPFTESKRDRFSIAPETLFKAQKYARDQNLAIVGIYHSHPDQIAKPSEFDRAIAWDTYSYIIMAVKKGTVTDCRSWRLNEQKQFQQETIVTDSCN